MGHHARKNSMPAVPTSPDSHLHHRDFWAKGRMRLCISSLPLPTHKILPSFDSFTTVGRLCCNPLPHPGTVVYHFLVYRTGSGTATPTDALAWPRPSSLAVPRKRSSP